jgi:fatty acid synthase subunit alpha
MVSLDFISFYFSRINHLSAPKLIVEINGRIETQDVILAERSAERIVEVGPSDTLGGMARRTLASKYEAYDAAQSLQRQILCYNKDAKEIYYDVEPVDEEQMPAASAGNSDSSATLPPAAAAPVAAPSASAEPAAQVGDAPVQAIDIIRSIVAQKLKKSISDIPLTKAIKDLVNGKSTLQNEILGGRH